ncbi:hypothetical protein Poli38472_014538 [Pythium oligandrum]|uniref:Uncharacterized protein n=2 Tax=Pythiaceae TaxID=4782 RepID=A0A8K1CF70_PYTOL|nr:hypothetical protein Poli38472_014538 [Pythium oligandrum]DBA02642.1 TPA: hypothetical protein N0F65_012014 [Lagenidium giganteum]|eukprot:TMW61077.1 hypothetical protein Poli38472_014538 [Pythium oligandrum]
MTISRTVYNQLFEHTEEKEQVIRLRPTDAKAGAVVMSSKHRIQMWTKEEHERFLEALEKFPAGPWKRIADHIGTKTPRQTMTHAQKYRQKIFRRQRGLRNQKRSPNGADGNMAVSPNGVADLKHAQGEAGAAGQNSFGLLDILAYSAAAAQSGQLQQVRDNGATYPQGQQPAEFPAQQMYPQPAPAADAAQSSAVSSPTSSQASSSLCANSHLPPLSEILQLRGSQVAQ